MANRQWNFTSDGAITDGVNTVKFEELAKFNTTTNRVETISGEAIPISVTDSDKLGGESKTSYLLKSELSANGKGILSGTIDYNNADMEEVVSQALTSYVGGGMHPTVPMVGMELLPNVAFENSNNVIVENAANVAVNSNKLRITKSTIDNPVVYETVNLEANKVYRVKIARYNIGANVTTKLSVVDSGNVEIISRTCTTDELLIDLGFSITTAGTYKVKVVTYTTVNNIGCEYYNFSCREINIAALEYGHYLTYKDKLMYTEVVTNVDSKPLIYDPTVSYSNEMYNNLAFLYDSFDLIQYISPTAGLSGFLQTNGIDNEYMKDANGKWIGDFKGLTVGELTSYINLFGSGSKTVDGTSGLLTIQRTAIDNVTPTLKASINYTGVDAGAYYFISFYIEDIVGEWYADIYNGVSTVRHFLSGHVNAGFPLTERNTVKESKTVRLLVKSQGKPCVVNILRDNVLNNPISLTDKISIKDLSVKVLDSTVWTVHTPESKMESSPVLNWKSSDVMFMPNIDALPVNGQGDNNIRFSNSILGNGNILGSGGDLYNFKTMAGHISGAQFDSGEFIKFTNRGIKIYSNGLFYNNINGKSYSVLHTSYNKVRIYRDEHGMKQLIVSDPLSGVSTTLFQISVSSVNRRKQEIKHDLLKTPTVANISLLNRQEANPWTGYQIFNKPENTQDFKVSTYSNSVNDMVHSVYMLNKNNTTTIGLSYETLWLHLNKESLTLALHSNIYTAMEYGIGMVRSSTDNENRKSLIYAGTNTVKLLKTDFKPLLMINCNMNQGKVKRTHIVNMEFGKDKYYAIDGTVPGYVKQNNAIVALSDNGVALLEYNTSSTDGNSGCIERFNAAPLPGTVGNTFWYHATIYGTKDGKKYSTVRRPKPTAKLNISDLLVSTVTTTNDVVGKKYTITKTNKIVGE